MAVRKLTAKEVSQEISQAEGPWGPCTATTTAITATGTATFTSFPSSANRTVSSLTRSRPFGKVQRNREEVARLGAGAGAELLQDLKAAAEVARGGLWPRRGAWAPPPPPRETHHHADQGFDQSIKQMFGCKNTREHAARLSITDAVLLNAERQMLSFVPKLRSAVSALTSGLPRQKGGLPAGVDFRHVEEETRTSYAQAAQRCVLLLSEAPCHRLKRILKEQAKYKPNESSGEVEDVKTLLKPYLTLIDQVLGDHRKMLTSKVWRDVCRGMWDPRGG